MNILHIIPNEKFTEPFIEFINSKFDPKRHMFFTYGNTTSFVSEKRENVIELTNMRLNFQYLITNLYKSQKIILHGLFNWKIAALLFFQPWLLKKCYWAIWGGDLYYYIRRKKNLKTNLYEYIRKSIIKKFGGFITQVEGDYELAKDWYEARGKYYYSFMYPSNLFKVCKLNKAQTRKLFIQIGNSADPSNNHIEILEKLRIYKDLDFEIVCPLSYGDKNYAEHIINFGKKIYGKKFIPIKDFMTFDKYIEILAKIDIAIFNHQRQQALGNITTLLGLGKKVYIREDITTWQFCKAHELKVYSVNDNFNDIFEKIDKKIKYENIENVKRQFSEEKLLEDLKKIFDDEDV